MNMSRNELRLVHGSEQYLFRYDNGCEKELLKALEECANNKECNFDMFDASVLSYQLGRKLQKQKLEALDVSEDVI